MTREHTFTFGDHPCTIRESDRSSLLDGISASHVVVADTNTARFVARRGSQIIIPPGEASKSWLELERILYGCLEANLARDSAVVGIGGGVVCDIASLAANLYLRGCTLVLIPTSLLAMVDASLGGKTGINFGGYKNMIGTFYPAAELRICAELLHTLPEREFRSGLAEVIKTAMLGDGELLELLESRSADITRRDDDLLEEAVWRSLLVKGSIVERDLLERGERAHLNLGHTFAHALESVEGLGVWTHGEAVAWGLAQAMSLGVELGITEPGYAERIRRLLTTFNYEVDSRPDAAEAILRAMWRDKKRLGGQLRFILQSKMAVTDITTVEEATVRAFLQRT